MSREPDRELLRTLALTPGAPGHEREVRRVVREALTGCGEVTYDRLGSILCEKRGSSDFPRILLDGHMDEVAFMVQSIGEDGRLRFVALGGWWEHVLLAQRVWILTEADERIPGVIGSRPPHFLSSDERQRVVSIEAMYIDIGATSRLEAESYGVRVGDAVVPAGEFRPLTNPDILSCKAFDNRVGIGILCETLRSLRGVEHPNTVIGVGAVQEEVGCRGARTASEVARPDVAIVLEGTPADDTPGFSEPQGVLGRGPQIRFFDPTAIASKRLIRFVEEVAAKESIPLQLAVRRSGGTDASAVHVHGRGVPTVVIGVPARYIHTHVSLIHWQDYAAAHSLVVALLERLDAGVARGLVDFTVR
ncbi:MAG: M42 family metallopeptidase [Planctomycetota bacterium]